MNQETISRLRELISKSTAKRVVGIIKGRYPFVTNLSGLDLSTSISILFLNSALRNIVLEDSLSKFNLTVWFEGGEFWTGHNLSHLDSLDFPDLKLMIADLCHLVDSKGLRLVAMEEQFVRFVADVRNIHGIPGPKPNDIEPYSDKMKIKCVAMKNNIKTAKYKVIRTEDLRNDLSSLEHSLSYPIFIKPTHGVGSAGTAQVKRAKSGLHILANVSTCLMLLCVCKFYKAGIP